MLANQYRAAMVSEVVTTNFPDYMTSPNNDFNTFPRKWYWLVQ